MLFGSSVCYNTEPGKRGPKGNLDTRAPVAKYLGFARDPPTAYLILCTNGNVVARSPRGVVPLDEVKLASCAARAVPSDSVSCMLAARRVPADRLPDGVPGARGREPSASLMTNAST